DVVGFSLQYEMLYTNVLAMLELAGIPVLSDQRTDEAPIVIAGGPGACAPEPMADFVDLFFPGDGEEVIVEFAELVRAAQDSGQNREETILRAARELDGAYAPAYYEPAYNEDGTLKALRPTRDGLPKRVTARKVPDLELAHFPTDLIVPFVETVHDRVSLEIMRGCTRGCRFCQAGMLRRPVRPRSVEQLRELTEEAVESTGYDEVALASLSSSDYPEFRELLERIGDFTEPRQVNLSLSSLRVSDQLTVVPEVLQRVRKSGLTVAPEAGTERLRNVINKDVTEEELIDGAREAFRQGWRHIKLYFMVGLPTETDEDLDAIVDLSEKVSRVRGEVAGGAGRVNVSIAPFVPKPHTPFQWEPMASREYIERARDRILDKARLKSVRYDFHDPERSVLEAALARGDRRLGRVLLRVRREGARFDAWDEHFSFETWQRAFEEEGLSLDFYAHRARDPEETLPWDHIDFGLRRDFLLQEREKAFRGELTPDCRTGRCTECGVCSALPEDPRRV
ncbi:MAG: TIGR03960 family B12-binding radical SAM protein, partial [Candidatus Brocadiia bacterium]